MVMNALLNAIITSPYRNHGNTMKRQRGAALFMVLMVTLVIVALSVSLAVGVFGETKNARNAGDQAIARQGAEAALRDAEMDLSCMVWDGATKAFKFSSIANGNKREFCNKPIDSCVSRGAEGFTSTCTAYDGTTLRATDGVVLAALNSEASTCVPLPGVPCGADTVKPTDFLPAACRVTFGAATGQPALAITGQVGAPTAPIYSIELLTYKPVGGATGELPIYRIRARGYGRSASTSVDLESIYRPCQQAD